MALRLEEELIDCNKELKNQLKVNVELLDQIGQVSKLRELLYTGLGERISKIICSHIDFIKYCPLKTFKIHTKEEGQRQWLFKSITRMKQIIRDMAYECQNNQCFFSYGKKQDNIPVALQVLDLFQNSLDCLWEPQRDSQSTPLRSPLIVLVGLDQKDIKKSFSIQYKRPFILIHLFSNIDPQLSFPKTNIIHYIPIRIDKENSKAAIITFEYILLPVVKNLLLQVFPSSIFWSENSFNRLIDGQVKAYLLYILKEQINKHVLVHYQVELEKDIKQTLENQDEIKRELNQLEKSFIPMLTALLPKNSLQYYSDYVKQQPLTDLELNQMKLIKDSIVAGTVSTAQEFKNIIQITYQQTIDMIMSIETDSLLRSEFLDIYDIRDGRILRVPFCHTSELSENISHLNFKVCVQYNQQETLIFIHAQTKLHLFAYNRKGELIDSTETQLHQRLQFIRPAIVGVKDSFYCGYGSQAEKQTSQKDYTRQVYFIKVTYQKKKIIKSELVIESLKTSKKAQFNFLEDTFGYYLQTQKKIVILGGRNKECNKVNTKVILIEQQTGIVRLDDEINQSLKRFFYQQSVLACCTYGMVIQQNKQWFKVLETNGFHEQYSRNKELFISKFQLSQDNERALKPKNSNQPPVSHEELGLRKQAREILAINLDRKLKTQTSPSMALDMNSLLLCAIIKSYHICNRYKNQIALHLREEYYVVQVQPFQNETKEEYYVIQVKPFQNRTKLVVTNFKLSGERGNPKPSHTKAVELLFKNINQQKMCFKEGAGKIVEKP